ncbi:carbon-nitrogen hydrolase family protein [bacterium]|nr:carbon-nitrogen hydrolase family protein [bacterium]
MKLKIATCQFPTSANIDSNFQHVSNLMKKAREQGAAVAHFPEACLSGYAGSDMESCNELNWQKLARLTIELIDFAGKLNIWIILGSTHRLNKPHKPHNSLYIINNNGQLIDRYDKCFCGGNKEETSSDLAHYTPGDHLSVFNINGIRCGALICHDYRYPELYREYKRKGVQLIFHSFNAAHVSPSALKEMEAETGIENHKYNWGTTYPSITMPASMIAVAASSHMWISCPNSSAKESCWGSFFVRADGVITGKLERHSTDILLSQIDTKAEIYDSTIAWRDRSLSGTLHSGTLVKDQRSSNRVEI